jgi:hypothetical protein
MENNEVKLARKMAPPDQTVIRFFLTIFVILTVAYFICGTYRNRPYKIEGDGRYYYQFLVSLVYDQDIDFTNNYLTPKYDWMVLEIDSYGQRGRINPVTHKPSNVWTIGPAILWFPFFVAALGLGSFLNLFLAAPLDLNPWGLFMQYGVMFSAVVYTMLALWLVYLILKDYFKTKSILAALTVLLFASNLIYYALFEVSMSHVYDFFSLALFIYCFKKVSHNLNRRWGFIALGAAGGLHTLVRTQNGLTIALFAGLTGFLIIRNSRTVQARQLWNFGLFLAVYLYSCLPIFLINNYLFASPFTIPQGSSFVTSPHFFEVLFSTHNGLFLLNPVLLIGFAGFIWLLSAEWPKKSKARLVLATLLVGFLGQVLINSATEDWWGGDAFGQRRLIGSYFIFAAGLSYLFEKIGRLSRLKQLSSKVALWLLIPANLYLLYLFIFIWDY